MSLHDVGEAAVDQPPGQEVFPGQASGLIVYSVDDSGHGGHDAGTEVSQVSAEAPHVSAEEPDATSSQDKSQLAASLQSVTHREVGHHQVTGPRGFACRANYWSHTVTLSHCDIVTL